MVIMEVTIDALYISTDQLFTIFISTVVNILLSMSTANYLINIKRLHVALLF